MTLGIPQAGVRPLDGSGNFVPPWYRFLGSLAQSASQDSGANPVPVTPPGSPYSYRAPADGALIVQGGGVSAMAFSRDGLTWYPLGSFYGMFPLSAGDQIRITYVAAPALTFVQR